MQEEADNEDDKWITVTGNCKTKILLKPTPKPKLHNSFAILSQPNAPTNYNTSSPTQKMGDDKTIIPPNPQEHHRQQKIAWCQLIMQPLKRLHESDNMFIQNNITHTKDECTILAKGDNNNVRHVAIDSAHAKHDTPNIRLAKRSRTTAYIFWFGIQADDKKHHQEQTLQLCQAI